MSIIGLLFLYIGYKFDLGTGYMIGAWFVFDCGIFNIIKRDKNGES